MQTVTVEEAQSQLSRLISQIGNGEDVVITQDDKPIAKLVPVEAQEVKTDKPHPQFGSAKGRFTLAPDFDDPLTDDVTITQDNKPRRQAGTAKGMVWISPDFDEPLEDFKEYM